MSKVFAEDNPFNALLTKVFDLCVLNMVTLICCVPIVTAGAALTAMYAVMLPMSEDKEGPIVKSFLKQFRLNLKGSVKTWLVILLAALVLAFDLYVWTKVESQYRSVFFGLTLAMLITLAVVASWYFGLRATFEDNGKTSLINAGKYVLIYLPVSILMGIYTAAIVYVYLQQGFVALLIPVFGVTVIEYPKACYMRRKFNAYIEDHSDIYGPLDRDEADEDEMPEHDTSRSESMIAEESLEEKKAGKEEQMETKNMEKEELSEEKKAGKEEQTETKNTEKEDKAEPKNPEKEAKSETEEQAEAVLEKSKKTDNNHKSGKNKKKRK